MIFSELLKECYPQLSQGKRMIADYINENMDIVAYCTVSSIAKHLHVSNAQIVKFMKSLGYSSYKEMQDSIREDLQQRVSVASFLRTWRETESGELQTNILSIVQQDIANIQSTFEHMDLQQLDAVADLLISSRRVGFIGARTSVGCGMLSTIFLGELREDVHLLAPGINISADILKWWGESDVVLGISALSYGKGFTVDLMDFAKANGCKTVWFTDSETFMQTPPKDYDHTILWSTKNALLSHVSIVSILNVLNYLVSTKLCNAPESISKTEQMMWRTWPDKPAIIAKAGQEKKKKPQQ